MRKRTMLKFPKPCMEAEIIEEAMLLRNLKIKNISFKNNPFDRGFDIIEVDDIAKFAIKVRRNTLLSVIPVHNMSYRGLTITPAKEVIVQDIDRVIGWMKEIEIVEEES